MMTDHLIPLPPNWRYVDQYAPNRLASIPSMARGITACTAMLAQIAAPGRWVPEELEDALAHKLVPEAGPDPKTASLAVILRWLAQQGLPCINLQPLVEGEQTLLKHTIERMNLMGIPQLLYVEDESKLTDIAGRKLHAWTDQGEGHALLRLGFSDSAGYGFYADPAASGFCLDKTGTFHPVPISWANSIGPAQVTAVLAVLPAGMTQPPADFDWLNQWWPVPVIQPDPQVLQQALDAIMHATQEREQVDLTLQAALAQAQSELQKGKPA